MNELIVSLTYEDEFLSKENFIYLGVDCPIGESGPRSVLILHHKGQYTSVHV